MLQEFIQNPLLQEIVIFSLLAVIRTFVVDIVGWRLLVFWMERNPWSWEYVTKIKLNVYSYSHGIAFVVSSIASYLLNRFITFDASSVDSETRVFVEFMSVSIFTLVVSVIIINVLTSNKLILRLSQKFPIIKDYWPMTAKLITIALTMVINFTGYKFLVFN